MGTLWYSCAKLRELIEVSSGVVSGVCRRVCGTTSQTSEVPHDPRGREVLGFLCRFVNMEFAIASLAKNRILLV